MNAEDLKKRTKQIALRILKLVAALPNTIEGNVIRGQLARAGTSVGSDRITEQFVVVGQGPSL